MKMSLIWLPLKDTFVEHDSGLKETFSMLKMLLPCLLASSEKSLEKSNVSEVAIPLFTIYLFSLLFLNACYFTWCSAAFWKKKKFVPMHDNLSHLGFVAVHQNEFISSHEILRHYAFKYFPLSLLFFPEL